MKEKVKRYYYLDILKFIAITCVCMYHFNKDSNILFSSNMSIETMIHRFMFGINSICIPIFFMVNGALILNKDLNVKEHIKKIIWIVIQYIFWRTITIIIVLIYRGNAISISSLINSNVDLAHLWFIPTFIGVYLFVPLVKKIYDSFNIKNNINFMKYLIITIIMLLAFITIPKIDLEIFKKFTSFTNMLLPMLFYFVLGGVLHKKIEKYKKINILILVLIFIMGAIMLFNIWLIMSESIGATYDNVYGGYTKVATLLMSSSLFLMIAKISQDKINNSQIISSFLRTIGNNTLSVYYFHWIFGLTLLNNIWSIVGKYGLVLNFCKALIMVIGFSYLGKVMKKIPLLNKFLH